MSVGVLTMLRKTYACIRPSSRIELKNATVDGFPGGCLNARTGSPASQYSSSHSIGMSRSKLEEVQMMSDWWTR